MKIIDTVIVLRYPVDWGRTEKNKYKIDAGRLILGQGGQKSP